MRAIHFSGCVDPGGHPAEGSENGKTKKKRRAAVMVMSGDGIFATIFHMDRA